MRASHSEYRSYWFTLIGGLVSLISAALPLVQHFIADEALFGVRINDRPQPEPQPLGIEFVSTLPGRR